MSLCSLLRRMMSLFGLFLSPEVIPQMSAISIRFLSTSVSGSYTDSWVLSTSTSILLFTFRRNRRNFVTSKV
eukprot:767359-Hanusia_phi.AAC.11